MRTLSPGEVVLHAGSALALAVRHPAGLDRNAARRATWELATDVLARLAGVPAHALRVHRSQQGKPRLDAAHSLWFNLSHGAAASLIALSCAGEIGCDIEDRLRSSDCDEIGATVLHPLELDWLATLPAAERAAMFARCWTRKEAVLKASGRGFSQDPRTACVLRSATQARAQDADGRTLVLHELLPPLRFAPAAVACVEAQCEWFELLSP